MMVVFDEDDSRYRCCCGCCHSKTGTWILAIIGLVHVVLFCLGCFGGGAAVKHNGAFMIGGGVFALLIVGIVIGCLLFGLWKEHHLFLIPMLICQVISIIFQVIFIVLLIVLAILGKTAAKSIWDAFAKEAGEQASDIKEFSTGVVVLPIIGFIVISVIYLCIHVWLFTVVRSCYLYFKEKREAETQAIGMQTTVASYTTQAQYSQYK